VSLERYPVIDDYGRLINPMLTRGQVQGGPAQGIGQAPSSAPFTTTARANC
jgi:aerobic carbon-monoxide dehydrogenase large subunit